MRCRPRLPAVLLVAVAVVAAACHASAPPQRAPATPSPASAGAPRAIAALLDSIAMSISMRDADAIAERMPRDSSVVYVTDGVALRGVDLRNALREFYGGLHALSFRWDSLQFASPRDGTWLATGWARISVRDTNDRVADNRAVFTWTVVWTHDRWLLALAHKTTLQ